MLPTQENPIVLLQGDCLDILPTLPDDSIDLLVTSPPYENCRDYDGIETGKLVGQQWVEWMIRVVDAAAPKVKGLIAINCEGRTRDFAYSGTPFLLFADLLRRGYTMRKPMAYVRSSFGGGGDEWFRNDWEPILCITRPGRLPWSDPLACGSPPKYKAGGRPTQRKKDGSRVKRDKDYVPPAISNPGNVINVGAAGGGNLGVGSEYAEQNEAPFSFDLANRLIRSFCPPQGIVCDCFAGSGTTLHAALLAGRRGIGIDVRASQIDLAKRRLAEPLGGDLFGQPQQEEKPVMQDLFS